eukprot:TRINITY_DN31440_c0_g1_i2.p1 TRINITY_DN31440_c0_g1~~TRINITY_DN31440_c0_g1_i2.p1  ORF type:complete len:443 (-),score=44.90 TRINITY_DN31440_c0_g1_i2:128-1456(-)
MFMRCSTRCLLTYVALREIFSARLGFTPADEAILQDRETVMRSKLAIERAVVSKFTISSLQLTENVTIIKPKVAFLFLAQKNNTWTHIWDSFFSGAAPGSYSIYVHDNKQEEDPTPVPLARWGAVRVHRVQQEWCALFGVSVALLHEALQDPTNQQFVFVSDSTIPLKNFNYVYSQLVVKTPQTSKVCFAELAETVTVSAQQISPLYSHCAFKSYLHQANARTPKHHQWIVLARRHAKIIINRALAAIDLYESSWRLTAPDLVHSGDSCSDEGAPVAALLYDLAVDGLSTGNTWADLARLGVEQQCLTFVNWRNCLAGTKYDSESMISDMWALSSYLTETVSLIYKGVAFDFAQSDLRVALNGFPRLFSSVDVTYLENLVQDGFMFARKFSDDPVVTTNDKTLSLLNVLPQLWDTVNERLAQESVWSRLGLNGMPSPFLSPT